MSFDTSGRGISQLPQRTLFVPQHLALLGVKGNCAKDPEPFLQAVSINLQVPLRVWFGPKYWAGYAESRRDLLSHINLSREDAEKHDSVLRSERSFLEMRLIEWILRDFYAEEQILRQERACTLGMLKNAITEPPDRHLEKWPPGWLPPGYAAAKLGKRGKVREKSAKEKASPLSP
jgi:hypothetical protein